MRDDELMLVTQRMEGDLASLFFGKKKDRYKINLSTKFRMAMDAAKGMNWLHKCEPIIIHGDLKLSNLLVSFLKPHEL
jgi:serine/threonine protein kinase